MVRVYDAPPVSYWSVVAVMFPVSLWLWRCIKRGWQRTLQEQRERDAAYRRIVEAGQRRSEEYAARAREQEERMAELRRQNEEYEQRAFRRLGLERRIQPDEREREALRRLGVE